MKTPKTEGLVGKQPDRGNEEVRSLPAEKTGQAGTKAGSTGHTGPVPELGLRRPVFSAR